MLAEIYEHNVMCSINTVNNLHSYYKISLDLILNKFLASKSEIIIHSFSVQIKGFISYWALVISLRKPIAVHYLQLIKCTHTSDC